jgi:hypothetical protein
MDRGFQPLLEPKTQQYKIDHDLTSIYFSTYVIVQWLCAFEGEKYFQKRIAQMRAEARPYWAPRIGNPGDQGLEPSRIAIRSLSVESIRKVKSELVYEVVKEISKNISVTSSLPDLEIKGHSD